MNNSHKEIHAIEQNALKINEEGIIILDNVKSLPGGGAPYSSPHYVICINHGGTLKGSYDEKEITFAPHDISVVYPDHIIKGSKLSNDYRATLIVVSAAALDEPLLQIIKQNQYRYEPQPGMGLQKHEYDVLMHVVSIMRETSLLDIENKRTMLTLQMQSFLQLLNYYRKRKLNDDIATNRISAQFHANLSKHFRQHHDVGFYAELACLTSKHFSTVIKQETGHSAAHWIHSQIVAEAKMLLHMRHDLSVQAIADMLGFDEQASFSRYFRRETGMSPSEFREGN